MRISFEVRRNGVQQVVLEFTKMVEGLLRGETQITCLNLPPTCTYQSRQDSILVRVESFVLYTMLAQCAPISKCPDLFDESLVRRKLDELATNFSFLCIPHLPYHHA